ncbi:MAG: hypothetical protein JXQ90_05305 [Cyclobacteriaceae bacterium]
MKHFLFTILILISGSLLAQPSHYVDSAGHLYWNKNAPVYLFISDNPEGSDSQRLTSERSQKYADPLYLDTEGINFIRTRNAVDPETKEVMLGTEVMFEIYADGIAPKTRIEYDNKVSYKDNDGTQYYKAGLTIDITATDNLSGIEKVSYGLNGDSPSNFTETIQFGTSGIYTLKYSSIDKVGNKEDIQEIRFAVDMSAPVSDLTINGITEDNIVGVNSKAYIEAFDSLAGTRMVYYKFDSGSYVNYDGKILPLDRLTEGNHTITYYAIDNVTNEEVPKTFEFYLDKSAPIMVADVLGDRFIVGDEIYFSGRTKLKLTAVDNKVGVKEIMYSIDNEEFQPYTDPIYLPSISGLHNIRFYSMDKLGNSTQDSRKSRFLGEGGYEEFKHNVSKVYVDLTGPQIDYKVGDNSFVRNDTLYIGPSTKIELGGEDGESGFREVSYSLNDEIGETPYVEAFTLSAKGHNTLHIYGYDNVNNRNVSKLPFYQDNDGPEIAVTFSIGASGNVGGVPAFSNRMDVYLSATDKTSGIKDLKYSLDGGPIRNYAGKISNLTMGEHTIKVFATDYLLNKGESEETFVIQ